MEFDDEHEDQDDEMEDIIPTTQPGFDSRKSGSGSGGGGGGGYIIRYRECLKNHAIGIGGHAVDGCGEFMPAGEEGSIDALKCAACNCHRNFHRKENNSSDQGYSYQQQQQQPYYHHHHQFSSYRPASSGYLYLTGPPGQQRQLALPAVSGGREEDDTSNPSSSGGGGGGSGMKMKRFRTKFSQEQKEKMLGFAEKVGWTIQKHDEDDVEKFCAETGVRRQVLKVWMHNNKHTLGKKP